MGDLGEQWPAQMPHQTLVGIVRFGAWHQRCECKWCCTPWTSDVEEEKQLPVLAAIPFQTWIPCSSGNVVPVPLPVELRGRVAEAAASAVTGRHPRTSARGFAPPATGPHVAAAASATPDASPATDDEAPLAKRMRLTRMWPIWEPRHVVQWRFDWGEASHGDGGQSGQV